MTRTCRPTTPRFAASNATTPARRSRTRGSRPNSTHRAPRACFGRSRKRNDVQGAIGLGAREQAAALFPDSTRVPSGNLEQESRGERRGSASDRRWRLRARASPPTSDLVARGIQCSRGMPRLRGLATQIGDAVPPASPSETRANQRPDEVGLEAAATPCRAPGARVTVPCTRARVVERDLGRDRRAS